MSLIRTILRRSVLTIAALVILGALWSSNSLGILLYPVYFAIGAAVLFGFYRLIKEEIDYLRG